MCCETYCALQLAAFSATNMLLYDMMDADSEDGSGPKGEPSFGRFAIPQCVACGNTSAAALLAGCAPSEEDFLSNNSTFDGSEDAKPFDHNGAAHKGHMGNRAMRRRATARSPRTE